jgi:hypothetical protein
MRQKQQMPRPPRGEKSVPSAHRARSQPFDLNESSVRKAKLRYYKTVKDFKVRSARSKNTNPKYTRKFNALLLQV